MGNYDVIIIGGGPGGYVAAERLGAAKKKVLLIEKAALGGTCLNVGCIPTKTLLNSAKHLRPRPRGREVRRKATGVSYDWTAMQAWKREVVEKLRGGIAMTEKKLGVEVLAAEAKLLGPGKVECATRQASRRSTRRRPIIIATGSTPAMPPIPGSKDNPRVVDSTGLLDLKEVPKRLCVIGGGVIGVEFAGLFAALGTAGRGRRDDGRDRPLHGQGAGARAAQGDEGRLLPPRLQGRADRGRDGLLQDQGRRGCEGRRPTSSSWPWAEGPFSRAGAPRKPAST